MHGIARHERNVPCRRALWGDDSRHEGAPGDVTIGVARETILT